MNRFYVIAFLFILGAVVIYGAKQKKERKLDYYIVLCGPANSDNETQYISTQKDGKKYLVQGEYREFPGCRVEKHLGKANKIEQIPN